MRIATWNVNSLRVRMPHLQDWLAANAVDAIALQETKLADAEFPCGDFMTLGFNQAYCGQRTYNGVAILSREPLAAPATRAWCARTDCRHAVVELPGGIELHNIYVPAGGDIPDPEANPKFAHKLQFLDEVTAWFAAERDGSTRPMVAVGDLNIAPLENDVWSHKQLLKVVSHTPVEVEKLGALQQAGGFVDAVRHFVPAEERLYTWWSYRNRDWAASDRGRRLDHVWVTPPLVGALSAARVHRDSRAWEKASDHVPVMIDIG